MTTSSPPEAKTLAICSTFTEYFLRRLSPNYVAWEDLKWSIESLVSSEEERRDLSSSVLGSLEKAVSFPVSRIYLRSVFTKTGLWLREPCELNIVGLDSEEDFNFVFKSYEDGSVTLLEENDSKVMGHGTTGLVSWQGAGLALEWANCLGINVLKGANVLELGSGLGLLGISLVKNKDIGIHSYVSTDGHPDVLNFLVNNARINLGGQPELRDSLSSWLISGPPSVVENLNAEYTDIAINSTFRVKYLNWCQYYEDQLPEDIDVILGSDLVYDVKLLPSLCSLLEKLIKRKPGCVAYISCTQRTFETLENFLRALRDVCLKADVVIKRTYSPVNDSVMMTHESFKPIVLYKITHE
ncbi:R08D74 [Caligus rogercresseyi]|uniref:R08D74 n=1 Tax=Caligus rogercresseyi TaxID=217165 RepID=A0A7T8GMM1_CALRO|nr:R08D74 [Caligus rogercresseyi]QQP33015.1 R08D74 [Caligus rogercresseyi]